jgi:hypothetical protein
LYSINEKKNIIIVLIAIIATLICQYIVLPLSFLHGLSAMLFYYLGYLFKKYRLFEKQISAYALIIMGVIWLYCIVFSHLEMSYCGYNIYPIDVLGAISGCYFTYILCKMINENRYLSNSRMKNIVLLLGKLSLLVLCFHCLEMNTIPWKKIIIKFFGVFDIQVHHYLAAGLIPLCRFTLTALVIYLIPKISFCRRLFSINNI